MDTLNLFIFRSVSVYLQNNNEKQKHNKCEYKFVCPFWLVIKMTFLSDFVCNSLETLFVVHCSRQKGLRLKEGRTNRIYLIYIYRYTRWKFFLAKTEIAQNQIKLLKSRCAEKNSKFKILNQVQFIWAKTKKIHFCRPPIRTKFTCANILKISQIICQMLFIMIQIACTRRLLLLHTKGNFTALSAKIERISIQRFEGQTANTGRDIFVHFTLCQILEMIYIFFSLWKWINIVTLDLLLITFKLTNRKF